MRKFFIGAGMLFIGRALSIISNILILTLVSRISGPIGLGLFVTILTTALFCSNICKFGLEQVAVAEAPNVSHSRTLTKRLLLKFVPVFALGAFLSSIILAAIFFIPLFDEYFSSERIVLFVYLFVLLFSYQFVLGEIFRAKGAFLLASLSKGGVSNLIMLSLLAWYYFSDYQASLDSEALWGMMLFAAGAAALSLSWILSALHWEVRELDEGYHQPSGYLKTGWHLLVLSLIMFLISQSDVWISAGVFGANQTGHYVAASKLVLMTTFIASLVNGVLTPKLARLAKQGDSRRFESLLRAASLVNFLFGALLATVLVAFAAIIIEMVFGPGFEGSVEILQILILGQIASILVGPVGYALIILHQEKKLLNASMVGLVTCWGAVLILSLDGLHPKELAASFGLGNAAFQIAMFVALKRTGFSALPSVRKLSEAMNG